MSNKKDTTIVICCAGMGTRLGIGTTKALLNIENKPLIIRQLELLQDYDDIRIVVGFQAEQVIRTVTEYRKDVMFVFNYDYQTTGTLHSLNKGAINARKYTIVMGGDFIVKSSDFDEFMRRDEECIAYTTNISSEPIYVNVDEKGNITEFFKGEGKKEWSGLARVKTKHILNNHDYVYEMLEERLPIKAMQINSIDIDTYEDYERAICWIENNYNKR